jgi:MYXO-CTERM domain-containing protein
VTDAECAADRKCFTDRGVCDDPNYTGKASPTQSDEGGCSYGAATTTPLWLALAALGLLRRRQR